jgi:hypothetical protein
MRDTSTTSTRGEEWPAADAREQAVLIFYGLGLASPGPARGELT